MSGAGDYGAAAVAVAATFVWLGMVLAISFLEAPLKFRAPGVTLQIGLGIGRLVFRALNACELVLAVTVAVALLADRPGNGAQRRTSSRSWPLVPSCSAYVPR